MTDKLSQEEIDALLNATADEEKEPAQKLTEMEADALGEIGNISFGSSATALSTLLGQKVQITTPTVDVISSKEIAKAFPKPYVAIKVNYTEGFSGSNMLVIQQSDAAIIADLMLGGTGQVSKDAELDEIHLSAVQECMNQMMGSAATSMSTVFSKRVDISPPSLDLIHLGEGKGSDKFPESDEIVRISFRLMVGDLIDSSIMQLVPFTFAKKLVNELMNSDEEELLEISKEEVAVQKEEVQIQQTVPQSTEKPTEQIQETQAVSVQPAEFSSFTETVKTTTEQKNLDLLLDIPLEITVELGRTKRTVKEILELGTGSIIELDKLAGEPVDIMVNSQLFAKGEVVVIEENFGVRITEISSKTDRIKKLR